ncbi:V-type ATP synthase subunit C [Miniphocaeibacter massiliensis]|uniref:V-type ATP synthase subunit C n=1 Tax=Miniphocaeibacter massiliensis TaxID=2041841 RepID=UPI000C0749C2|nr:V-type ATP synthase subunit C [Miniphocaeibacter massiliensis]
MDRTKFIQSSTTTRVYEKSLLTKSQFSRMIESDNLENAIKHLNDTPYQAYINKLSRSEDYEVALKEALNDTFRKYYEFLPSPEVVDLIAMKYEYHNLKVIIKEKISGLNYERMYINFGNFDFDKLKEEFESGDRSKLDSRYSEVINDVYDQFLEFNDPQNIDILIDKAYFEDSKKVAEQSDVDLFKTYVEDLIDFTNIRTLLRCQNQKKDLNFLDRVIIDGGTIDKNKYRDFLFTKVDENSNLFKTSRIYYSLKESLKEYNLTNSLSVFEKSMDNYLMEVIKEAKKVTYGPEVSFAYLLAKETEIKNLRIIFVSKLNKLPTKFTRERLRESYA